ncbi:hypothetical protein CDIK_4230, partial [Cucumispora dikerogammari]
QIYAVYQTNGNWRQIAQDLGVAASTAYRWVQTQGDRDDRGGKTYEKVLDAHRDYMISLIETNPRITLSEIRTLVSEAFDLNISTQTVARHLDSLTYTLKNVRFEPERANSLSNKEKRKLFVERLLEYQGQNIPTVFMDETNLNIHISEQKEVFKRKEVFNSSCSLQRCECSCDWRY